VNDGDAAAVKAARVRAIIIHNLLGCGRELCDAFLNECSALAMEERLIRTGRDTSERSSHSSRSPEEGEAALRWAGKCPTASAPTPASDSAAPD
jgi:hypothetical protein